MEAASHSLYQTRTGINQEKEFGYYADLAQIETEQELATRIGNIVSRLGFSDYTFINLECADTVQHELNTLPELLVQEYYDRDLYAQDMVLQRAMNTRAPFFSSTIHDYVAFAPFNSDMTKTMKTIYELNKSFGYYDFFHIPIKTEYAYLLFSVSIRGASPIDFKEKSKAAKRSLILLSEALENIINNQFPMLLPTKAKDTTINPKPLRVLNTLANNDLTIEQVANKLCISVVTANQHLKTVRQCLGVKTNYAAIKRALAEGLIQLDRTPGLGANDK